ncbi:kinase-like protein [Melanomma pulvis-pyrius CBS 109.77]|uniref:non-specific serine/threonine protein kinase n=1 Tax=Melanomma pulvis-pyrius CBS 109.77 TaxID=1314802 RepID=A0A6A6WPU1_9PLEO|nr:kinase-like protein [Melanomma pulvis-pyrius CBS 109.77]
MINIDDYRVRAPAESIAGYGDDGWIPIYIKDTFCNGRYTILNKLGHGGYATVWVARDHIENVDVCIKVLKAANSLNNQELRILQCIQQGADHPGREYLPKLLNHFYEKLHSKTNLFIVLELLGPPLGQVYRRPCTYNSSFSRRISKQLLLAVDCLHSHGIVHGDIHEGNILFCLPKGYQLPIDDVYQGEVYKKDGTPLEEGIPRQVVTSLLFDLKIDKDLFQEVGQIKLVDFSSSFFESETPERIHTREDVSPPELIFEKPLRKSFDIWSVACMTFYIATGRNLFEIWDRRRVILLPLIHVVVGDSSAQWLLKSVFEAIERGIWKDLGTFRCR